MIFGFLKKLIKYYIDKLINWLRMQKFNLELDNEIKELDEVWLRGNAKEKPEIIEKGTFGEDGWSISIGDVDDEDTKD
tara:strand:+ start:70 stop:303 length:234 start_codon:yes stop_codon:yes gene_type:complete